MPRLGPVLLAIAALLFTAPAAQADCLDQPLSRPFTPWLDYAQYFPAPDGSFAGGGAGWAFSGGASASGGYLVLPAGSSAITPPVCVTPVHPTIRFFVRGSGALATSVIANGVEVPIGTVIGPGGGWTPSPIQLIVLNLLGEQDVQFRFATVDGSIDVDDVWVDPYSKG